MNKEYSTLKYDIDENGIALVTLSRPQALNALNMQMFNELGSLFDELKDIDKVRVVIITGEGNSAFVAGTDINMMKDSTAAEVNVSVLKVKQTNEKIEEFPLPVIAAVNGLALGGGCELAMSCDIRIASTEAKFGQPEINLGIIPGGGGTQRLARLIGIGRAKQLVFTGDIIQAHRAYEIGLVDQLAEPEQLLSEAKKLAAKIAGKSKAIIKLAKKSINTGYAEDLECGLQSEMFYFASCFETYDRAEGMQAFVERRKPVFKDC